VATQPLVQVILLVPEPLWDSFVRFLRNLRYGDVVVNQFLQGKGQLALRDLARWGINSSLGVAGLFDPATGLGFERHEEDFGQTLAVWGLPQGPYIVLPLIGPTTGRDLTGFGIEFFTNPTFWLDEPLVEWPLTALSYLNQAVEAREGIAQVAAEAADPYVFIREAYLQRRRFLIYDGKPPPLDDALLDEALDEALDDLELEDGGADLEGSSSGPPAAADALPGLDDLEDGGPPTSPDDLPGLDEDLRAGGGPTGIDDLPGLDDEPAPPASPVDELPGLE
jgi:phospholipid-binding lipoprotein MlaA